MQYLHSFRYINDEEAVRKKNFSLHEWCECFILQKSDTGIVKSNRKRNTTEEKY